MSIAIENVQRPGDTELTDDMRTRIESFLDTACADEDFEAVLVSHEEMVRPGVDLSLHCGVWDDEAGDVPCFALAGPDSLGNWTGLDTRGYVRQFTRC